MLNFAKLRKLKKRLLLSNVNGAYVNSFKSNIRGFIEAKEKIYYNTA